MKNGMLVFADDSIIVWLSGGKFYYQTEDFGPVFFMQGDQKIDVKPTPETYQEEIKHV